jgi:hypothetical protein
VAVPRVLEKIHSELETKFSETSGIYYEKFPRYIHKICVQLKIFIMVLSIIFLLLIYFLGVKAFMLQWARSVAVEHFDSLLSGGEGVGARYHLAEKLVLGPIHARLGLDR